MKSTLNVTLVALVAAVAGVMFTPAALAQSGEQLSSPDYSHLKSLRSRADVQAEAAAANRSALLGWSGYSTAVPFNNRFDSSKTRAEVSAETTEAVRLGRVSSSGEYGPDITTTTPVQHAGVWSRNAARAQ